MTKTSNFVVDTNTLVSAFLLSNNTIAAQAYYKAIAKGQIIHSDETFNEFCDVFVRPKFDRYLPLNKRIIVIEDLKALTEIVLVSNKIKACRDPKDDKFLELAVSSGAACIITGDKDLLVLNPFERIPILTAAEFLKIF
jgi:putative PIN family toxin of toxin-antitoxin system